MFGTNKVWITRTLPGAWGTAKTVQAMGFATVVKPLLDVSAPDTIPPVPEDNCLLIFTSKNALSSFCDHTDCRHWPVITVGDATAELAKDCGFKSVISASGTAVDVLRLIKSKVKQSTPIIHCAGETIRVDIADALRQAGYQARRDVYYRTTPIHDYPHDLPDITYVLLHSPLAAKTLSELNADMPHMIAISVSNAANAELDTLVLREKRIANAPTEAALLACLEG